MTPEPPPGIEPIGPGHPMADIVHLAAGCDIRPSLTTYGPLRRASMRCGSGPATTAPDVLFACCAATCRRR